MKRNDLTGKIFGDLKVLNYTRTRKCGKSFLAQWMTECIICGAKEERGGKNLKRGSSKCKKCSLSGHLSNKAKKQFRKGTKDISLSYFGSIKRGARRRNKFFNITIEYCQNILEKQEYKCSLTGLPLIRSLDTPEPQCTASIDRIDSSIGYIEGNIQWVLKDVNNMKMNLTEERFLELAKKVVEHSESNQEMLAASQEEDAKLEDLPDDDDPYWEE